MMRRERHDHWVDVDAWLGHRSKLLECFFAWISGVCVIRLVFVGYTVPLSIDLGWRLVQNVKTET